MAQTRLIAVKLLNKFYNNSGTIDELFSVFLNNTDKYSPEKPISKTDKNLISELVYGVIRWQIWLDHILQQYININKTRTALLNILRITLYQILFLNKIPNYACVNVAVEMTKVIYIKNYETLSKFVNGVLQAVIRDVKAEKDYAPTSDNYITNLSIKHSHPEWIVKRLNDQYGQYRAEKIITNNNTRPRLTLRINTNQTTTLAATQQLNNNNIPIFLNLSKSNCIIIDGRFEAVRELELWKTGAICIQDLSSTLCAMLCAPLPTNLIFDLCAAPGGKTIVLSEMLTQNKTNTITGKIICNDINTQRLEKCKENIYRMKSENIEFTNQNIYDFSYPQKADIVLLDAPCSGLGTIRKNPDIKFVRTEEQLNACIQHQRAMLLKARTLLKKGGHLIYSICSIDKEEGEENIKWFLETEPRFELEDAANFIGPEYTENKFLTTATLLGEGITDGAFAARLVFKG